MVKTRHALNSLDATQNLTLAHLRRHRVIILKRWNRGIRYEKTPGHPPGLELCDSASHPIGRHYPGPTWALKEGSQGVGEVIARAAAPAAQTIPWLVLTSKAITGQGRLSAVTYIQRVNTIDGQAPAAGCDSAQVGHEQRIAYTATYHFYVTQP